MDQIVGNISSNDGIIGQSFGLVLVAEIFSEIWHIKRIVIIVISKFHERLN